MDEDIFILLLGGSKFMGLNFVEQIIEKKKNYTKKKHSFIYNK